MRVGIYAPNSVSWLVYDLALIAIGAVSVPFTDDFQGSVDDALLARYGIVLLLTAKCMPGFFPASRRMWPILTRTMMALPSFRAPLSPIPIWKTNSAWFFRPDLPAD